MNEERNEMTIEVALADLICPGCDRPCDDHAHDCSVVESTAGNRMKGTFTNAAKLAIARIGPGHEVYLGAADFDPDTDEDAAKAQGQGNAAAPSLQTVSAQDAAALKDAFDKWPAPLDDRIRLVKTKLGAMGVSGVGSLNQALAKLSPAQGAELDGWLAEQIDKAGGSAQQGTLA